MVLNGHNEQEPEHGTYEYEYQQPDGVLRYDRIRSEASPSLLWLTLTQEEDSWGKIHNEPRRTFEDFLHLIELTSVRLETISLGLMTSSPKEYYHMRTASSAYPFARLTILLHRGFNEDDAPSRQHRHDDFIQTARRAEIAQMRNYLMLKTLRDEPHILWLDADIFELDTGLVQRMMAHSEAQEDTGIITARCTAGENRNYDLNAWAGTRESQRHVVELTAGTAEDDLVHLDTVGATILYMRASLVWRGLSFPHQFVVGTSWGNDGVDGLESEGLCYRARGLQGGGCAVMGGAWK